MRRSETGELDKLLLNLLSQLRGITATLNHLQRRFANAASTSIAPVTRQDLPTALETLTNNAKSFPDFLAAYLTAHNDVLISNMRLGLERRFQLYFEDPNDVKQVVATVVRQLKTALTVEARDVAHLAGDVLRPTEAVLREIARAVDEAIRKEHSENAIVVEDGEDEDPHIETIDRYIFGESLSGYIDSSMIKR